MNNNPLSVCLINKYILKGVCFMYKRKAAKGLMAVLVVLSLVLGTSGAFARSNYLVSCDMTWSTFDNGFIYDVGMEASRDVEQLEIAVTIQKYTANGWEYYSSIPHYYAYNTDFLYVFEEKAYVEPGAQYRMVVDFDLYHQGLHDHITRRYGPAII